MPPIWFTTKKTAPGSCDREEEVDLGQVDDNIHLCYSRSNNLAEHMCNLQERFELLMAYSCYLERFLMILAPPNHSRKLHNKY